MMKNENALLRDENESKPSLLQIYYNDVLDKFAGTRQLIDLNDVPPQKLQ
jgi:hypothetical protein